MNLKEVEKILEQQFAREFVQGGKRNIIFWYDENGEFADSIDDIALDNVTIKKLGSNNMFAVKIYIEEIDKENNILVYSPLPQPDIRDNWLADTIKYSQLFTTDIVSVHMLNLGIDNALRSVVGKYKKFFANAERVKKFEGYGLVPNYSERKIDLAVLSVLCKLTVPNIDYAVQTLLIEMVKGESDIYDNLKSFGDINTFWAIIKETYGYKFQEQSLEKLAITLLCSHLSHSLDEKMKPEWNDFVSANPNCFVLVDNLMRNSQYLEDYNALAVFVADKMNLSNDIRNFKIDEIVSCDTFADFDNNIISRITDNINKNAGEYEYYRSIIDSRKSRRYYPQFGVEYSVLYYACEYLKLSVRYKDLSGTSATELFEGYTKEFYKIDSSYRHFILAYDRLENNDSFRTLFKMVENSYTNWFLNELSVKWGAFWDDDAGSLTPNKWILPGITSQQSFYSRFIYPFVKDNERVFVFISDGLRYETAVELNTLLNREQKGKGELETMLGVIPSYTALGMASLLPHKQIEVTKQGDFIIDGISAKGTENRGKILAIAKKESLAVKFEEVMALGYQEVQKRFADTKLIYIYHNVIDSTGDKAETENDVFTATEKAFRDIDGLIKKLRPYIVPLNVFITADHGYIYRRTPLQERDKTPKEDLVGVKSSRRYILARENIEQQGIQSFSMQYLTKNHNDMYAVLPRSTNCFKLQGSGSRYVHGGTSLQEVVIPVIKFRSDKNTAKTMNAEKVTIRLTSLSHKITSKITHLSFHQNEPVDDKHLPLTVTVYFADESGERISNENVIFANSTEILPERRMYKEKFTLKDMAYNKEKAYYLVLKDDSELVNTEIERIPFVIDLVFGGTILF